LLAGYRRPELATEKPADIALRVQAMQWRYPDAVAGWRTAAVLHGLWLLGPVGPVQLLRTRGYPRRKHDVRVDSVPLPSEHLAVVEGVVATGLTRTAVDLIEQLTGREALAIADSALRACFPVEDLLAMAAEVGHHEGGSVHRVLELADARSQSALESMSRWLFHVKRLPAPEPQVLIGDDAGPFALVDFLWREQGVVGEADGMIKYDETSEALRAEKLRQERLEELGFIVVRWGFADVTERPDLTIARVRSALARGSARRSQAS
jgi:hypothetical protein